MRGQPNIRQRVLAVALLPVTLVAALLSAVFMLGRMGDLDEAHALRARSLIRQIASASEYGIFSANIESLQAIAAGALHEPDVQSVIILDRHGAVLAQAGRPRPDARASALVATPVGRSMEGPYTYRMVQAVLASQLQLDDLELGARPQEPGLLGHVVLDMSRETLSAREREMLLVGTGVALGGLLLGLFLALRISQGVLRPIQSVAEMIERIGRGELSTRAEVLPDDPLGDLHKGLNQMAQRLQQARDELEQRIEAATLELRAKKEEAETATLAKSRFLAAASHDLRQPTHALGLFVARLAQLPHDEETHRLVGNLDASVQAMQNLLDALLDISRFEAGAIRPNVTAFPLANVLNLLRSELETQALDKGLSLRVHPCDAWVTSDAALLHRILLNLVSNALRYTQSGGVVVGCRSIGNGSGLRIEVWDSGIGIPPEHRQDIFREFFQIGNVERDRRKGLGLGLNIVERTARLLGHPLGVCSVPGRGSRFALEVPRAASQERFEPVVTELLVPNELAGLSVLLVEDDALSATALAELLLSWGCDVRTAEGLYSALWHLKQGFRPDLLISDYRLRQEENGIDVTRRVRDACGRPLPALLISGDTDAEFLQSARDAGLTLLHKPLRPAKLRTLMRRLLRAGEA